MRQAQPGDAELIYAWRNHPSTRRVSRDSAEIAWPAHRAWFRQVLSDPRRTLLLGTVGSLPVGVIRLDPVSAMDVEVSLYLDPAMYGLGLGPALLRAGEAHARQRWSEFQRFVAQFFQETLGHSACSKRPLFARSTKGTGSSTSQIDSGVAIMKIGMREIGPEQPPYLIAEMSGNHNRSLERALAIVDAAAEAGADAIKLQTYTADTMTLDVDAPGFVIDDPDSLWAGRRLHDLYDEAHTPWEWHTPIVERARSLGLDCFSTPFDESAVDFLESLDVPAYKIASFEIVDLPLIRKVASTGKPMIVSTGMASLAEIDEAVTEARRGGCAHLVLLKCTSTYPASPENSNVATIPNMRHAFRCEIGLSDHTMGCGVAIAAVALGATVIEKHFTLRRADGGVDAAFSLEPEEFLQLRRESERAWRGLGSRYVRRYACGGAVSSLPSIPVYRPRSDGRGRFDAGERADRASRLRVAAEVLRTDHGAESGPQREEGGAFEMGAAVTVVRIGARGRRPTGRPLPGVSASLRSPG